MNRRAVAAVAVLLLFPLAACLPPEPVAQAGPAAAFIVSGPASSPEGGAVGSLLELALDPAAAAAKAVRVTAWGTAAANQHPKAVYVYLGEDLPIAVNITAPIRWWRCQVLALPASREYSGACEVGNLAGDTITSVHSLKGTHAWEGPIRIRGAGKGALLGDVVQSGLVVEVLR